MADNLIYVQEYPLESSNPRYPSIDADGTFLLDSTENVLWSGRCPINTTWFNGKIWKQSWKSPEPARVALTDRRLVYSVTKFDKGSSYVGGFVIDTAIMTAVSKTFAASRRRGRVAVGQLLSLWPMQVSLHEATGIMKRVQSVSIRCQIDDLPYSLILDLPAAEAGQFAELCANAVARRRLQKRRQSLTSDQILSLESVCSRPAVDQIGRPRTIALPGALKVGFEG